MSKHTKGPWTLIIGGPHWNNPGTTNYQIAWSSEGELVVDHVYEEADAHLIAAAPELLEALEVAFQHIDKTTHCNDWAKVCAAIAKAKGE